ncbi:MAG TPA: helix-turn-helix domain-containing protein [Pirellulaceae bacterium]|nr:helix-turn-helix domain-containing protein [Pirellulaceae bacterium]
MAERQQEIDYENAQHFALIDRCPFPPMQSSIGDKLVKRDKQQGVLRALFRIHCELRRRDQYTGELFPSLDLLKHHSGYSLTTVRRAIDVLEKQQILIVRRPEKNASNRYTIDWSAIKSLSDAETFRVFPGSAPSVPQERAVCSQGTPREFLIPNPKSLLEEASEKPNAELPDVDWDRVEERAAQLSAQIPPRSVNDALTLCRVAVLMQTTIGDGDVHHALAQTRRKRPRCDISYFQKVLSCETDLPEGILRAIRVPRRVVNAIYQSQGSQPCSAN